MPSNVNVAEDMADLPRALAELDSWTVMVVKVAGSGDIAAEAPLLLETSFAISCAASPPVFHAPTVVPYQELYAVASPANLSLPTLFWSFQASQPKSINCV